MSYTPKNANGQATMANSEPVVIASDQTAVPVSASSLPLPTGAATGAKQDTGNTSLGNIDTSTAAVNTVVGAKTDAKSTATDATSASMMAVLKQISASAQAPPSQAVTNAGTFAVQATLAAETTKVVGTVRTADGSGNLYTSNSSTFTAKNAQDANLLGTLGTAFSTAGKVDIKGADGDVFVRNATATNLKVDASGVAVPVTDNSGSLSVDWNGTQPVTGAGTATGALRVELPTNGTGTVGLNAGTNAIGKLAANAGVNIGDVAVTSISAGTNLVGDVGIQPRTSNGLTTYHLVSAGTTNATNIKASAGQVFGWYIYNSNASARKVAFHNTAGSPTAGASIFFSLVIPPNSGANVFNDIGIAFSTGIAITTVTGLADNDTAAVAANDLIINIWYK